MEQFSFPRTKQESPVRKSYSIKTFIPILSTSNCEQFLLIRLPVCLSICLYVNIFVCVYICLSANFSIASSYGQFVLVTMGMGYVGTPRTDTDILVSTRDTERTD